MPITEPNDFPQKSGIDPRDENHPFFPKKPTIRVFLKPLAQKVIEKHLWLEITLILLVIILGITPMVGATASSGMYVLLGAISTAVLYRFIHIEDETHGSLKQPLPQPTPSEPVKE